MGNTGDRYSSNDFTSGKYKDVAFSQADVHIKTGQKAEKITTITDFVDQLSLDRKLFSNN